MEPRVTGIMFKKGKIRISWDEESKKSHTVESTTKESSDPPKPEFSRAWERMQEHFRTMLEFPKNFYDSLSVESINISRQDEMISCEITGYRALENAKGTVKLKGPQYSWDTAAEAEDQGGKKNRMTKECYEDLIDLESKALLYVGGDRAQLELALESSPGVEIDPDDQEEMETAL